MSARETAEDRVDAVHEGLKFLDKAIENLSSSALDSSLRLLQIQVADAQVHATLALVDAVNRGNP